MDLITNTLVAIGAWLGEVIVRIVTAVLIDTATAAVNNPSATAMVSVAVATTLAMQGLRLKRLGLLAGAGALLPLAIITITWREFGRVRRSVLLGVIAGFPVACAWTAATRPGPARWNASWAIIAWTLVVFWPGDVLPPRRGGLLYRRIGGGTIRQWWLHEAARETIESSMRRTIDPRVQVSKVRPAGDGRWDARVLVPEKMSPEIIDQRAQDHTIGSTLTRVAHEKGFSERVQDVVVRETPSEGVGVQTVSVLTGNVDPLAAVSHWQLPAEQPHPLAPIEIGRYATGEPVLVPVPGAGGSHILAGGESGSGKTTLEDAFIGQLALRPDIAIVASDPKWVGMAKWNDRLTTVALGRTTATPLLLSLVDLMEQRKELLAGTGGEDWDLRLGPWVVAVFDEAGVLGLGREGPNATALHEIISQGRALGVGVLMAMHRPSTGKLMGDLRDLFPVRIGLAMGSQDASQMIFGAEGAPPAHKISESEKGYGYIRIHRQTHRFRVHLGPQDVTAKQLAERTAHLRVAGGEFAGWPHRIADPARHKEKSAWEEFTEARAKAQHARPRTARVKVDD